MISLGLVDDHPIFRIGLRTAVSREPDIAVAWEAASHEEAISRMESEVPTCLLVDLTLERAYDGLELARRVRSQPKSPKVLVMSGFADPATLAAALGAGVHGFIEKGIPIPELATAIRECAAGAVVVSGRITAIDTPLSSRELQVLVGIRTGHTNREIAAALQVGTPTVNKHVHSVLTKLNVRNRAEAAALLNRPGLGEALMRPDPAPGPDTSTESRALPAQPPEFPS